MFCRKRRGMFLWQHSWMKWVPCKRENRQYDWTVLLHTNVILVKTYLPSRSNENHHMGPFTFAHLKHLHFYIFFCKSEKSFIEYKNYFQCTYISITDVQIYIPHLALQHITTYSYFKVPQYPYPFSAIQHTWCKIHWTKSTCGALQNSWHY